MIIHTLISHNRSQRTGWQFKSEGQKRSIRRRERTGRNKEQTKYENCHPVESLRITRLFIITGWMLFSFYSARSVSGLPRLHWAAPSWSVEACPLIELAAGLNGSGFGCENADSVPRDIQLLSNLIILCVCIYICIYIYIYIYILERESCKNMYAYLVSLDERLHTQVKLWLWVGSHVSTVAIEKRICTMTS